MDSVSMSDASATLGTLAARAHQGHESTVLTEQGQAVAAIVPVDVLEDLEDARALLEHQRQVQAGTAAPSLTHEEFLAELDAEDHRARAS